jgi:hypothetical protein
VTRFFVVLFVLVALISFAPAPAIADDPVQPEEPGDKFTEAVPSAPKWLTRGFRPGPRLPPIPDPPPIQPVIPTPEPKGSSNIGTPITVEQGRGGERLASNPSNPPTGSRLFNGLAASGGIAPGADQETRRQVRILIRRLG